MTTLAMWTVYDHPSDYPDSYVARRFDVDADGPRPSDQVIAAPELAIIRKSLHAFGLVPLGREPGDDPKIVETWI